MNFLEDVPFKMTISFVDASMGEENFVHAPEFEMPNCSDILMCTMHDFSLEKKVLYWIDSASREGIRWYQVTTDIVPTAPPCWLLLVDSKENLSDGDKAPGNKVKGMAPVRRCVRLVTAAETFRNQNQSTDQVDEDFHPEECSEDEEPSSTTSAESDGEERPPSDDANPIPNTLPRFLSLPQGRPKTSPGPLSTPVESDCPKPPLLKQRQSMFLFRSMKNELEGAKKKLAAFMHPLNRTSTESTLASRAFSLHQRSRSSRNLRYGPSSDLSRMGTLTPTPPSTPCCSPRPLTAAGVVPPVQKHKPTIPSLSPYSCLPPLPGIQRPLGSHKANLDSTTDLLSALSQEERDLIEPVLALGYPIRRAILALQKTGKQSLGQFLSYLSACDKLLIQGYEEAQVEEAMEMFQNSEKKATEFLHLLVQFNDMGFQQADIKEVLLLCENHRDLALEELMTRTQ
ncbi:ubiquitin-associated protein 1-like [Sceloporus undulatus]|uniref:ubiquitin-associated protein 1-like n=1 Tax=Sceloporus undulatus TaxID=8520 RepID=UPI001C4B6A11|nr:ubiquitin-associated protein 1-like [Sceloporus undulatus]